MIESLSQFTEPRCTCDNGGCAILCPRHAEEAMELMDVIFKRNRERKIWSGKKDDVEGS